MSLARSRSTTYLSYRNVISFCSRTNAESQRKLLQTRSAVLAPLPATCRWPVHHCRRLSQRKRLRLSAPYLLSFTERRACSCRRRRRSTTAPVRQPAAAGSVTSATRSPRTRTCRSSRWRSYLRPRRSCDWRRSWSGSPRCFPFSTALIRAGATRCVTTFLRTNASWRWAVDPYLCGACSVLVNLVLFGFAIIESVNYANLKATVDGAPSSP